MQNLKIDVRQENGVISLKCEKQNNQCVTNDITFAYEHEKINNLLPVFYDLSLNTEGFVYLEFVKYQLGLHRNMQAFAKCNICISAIQLFYIQTCPGFLPIEK